jgi:hypothetical protein
VVDGELPPAFEAAGDGRLAETDGAALATLGVGLEPGTLPHVARVAIASRMNAMETDLPGPSMDASLTVAG